MIVLNLYIISVRNRKFSGHSPKVQRSHNKTSTKSQKEYRIRSRNKVSPLKFHSAGIDDWSAPCGVLRDCIATRFSLANLLFGCPGAILGAPLAGRGRGSGSPGERQKGGSRGQKRVAMQSRNTPHGADQSSFWGSISDTLRWFHPV